MALLGCKQHTGVRQHNTQSHNRTIQYLRHVVNRLESFRLEAATTLALAHTDEAEMAWLNGLVNTT
jgi:hypothetical protein